MMTIERQRDVVLHWVLQPQHALRVRLDAIDARLSRRLQRRLVGAPVRARSTFRGAVV